MQTAVIEQLSDYELERNKPMPSRNHSFIQSALIHLLWLHYKKQFTVLSELSLDLAEWPSVPDLSIYKKLKIDFSNDEISMKIPPLCAIEILSPSQPLNDLSVKAAKYFEFGVKSCWIVLPVFRSIHVFSSPTEYEMFKWSETLRDDALGIELSLAEVFEEG